jgi:hypothetical protein
MSDQAPALTFGSTWEQNVYMALLKMKLPFDYQVPKYGGRNVRGGTVLDFIVFTPPSPTVIQVDGPYWHRTERAYEETIIQANLERDGYRVLKIVEDSETEERALRWLKANL